MLDGPVPEGARSVSWPWYHHILTNELTMDARTLFERYAKVPSDDVENHIYRIVSSNTSRPLHILLGRWLTNFIEGQSLGYLSVAMHWGILVPELRPGQAPTLSQSRSPTFKDRRLLARSGLVYGPRPQKACV